MNEAKWKLLELIREPITIKELQYRTGMKWANLSLHLKDLDGKWVVKDTWYMLDECGRYEYMPDEYTIEEI